MICRTRQQFTIPKAGDQVRRAQRADDLQVMTFMKTEARKNQFEGQIQLNLQVFSSPLFEDQSQHLQVFYLN